MTSACVLPIAPEFEDPPAAQNFAPQIVASEPVDGLTVATVNFSVTLADPNVGDTLHVRWIAEYPPYILGVTRVLAADIQVAPSPDGRALRGDFALPDPVDCTLSSLPSGSQHQIYVAVADREFADDKLVTDPQVKLTTVTAGGLSDEAHWTLNLNCP